MYEIKKGMDGKDYFVFANADDAAKFYDMLYEAVGGWQKAIICICSFGAFENAVEFSVK